MNKAMAIDVLRDYTDTIAIQRLLLSQYKIDSTERVRRGTLQRYIASTLNLTINPRFYSLMSTVIAGLPIKNIKVQGIAHYKGITLR